MRLPASAGQLGDGLLQGFDLAQDERPRVRQHAAGEREEQGLIATRIGYHLPQKAHVDFLQQRDQRPVRTEPEGLLARDLDAVAWMHFGQPKRLQHPAQSEHVLSREIKTALDFLLRDRLTQQDEEIKQRRIRSEPRFRCHRQDACLFRIPLCPMQYVRQRHLQNFADLQQPA